MKTATEYLYPVSEPTFEEWEGDQTAGGANMIVKLAYKSLAGFCARPLWGLVAQNDFLGAQQQVWESAGDSQQFLAGVRSITNQGCRFIRFHAVGARQTTRREPPLATDDYWRAVSLYFTHLNGPLAGEETFVVPPDVDTAVGLSRQYHEAHVALTSEGHCLGVSTVQYNRARSRVYSRTFYEASHEVARSYSDTTRRLLDWSDQEQYRLPYVRPPAEIEQRLGLHMLEAANYVVEPQTFNDILPPGIR